MVRVMELRDSTTAFLETGGDDGGAPEVSVAVRRSLARAFGAVGAIAATGLVVVALTRGPIVGVALVGAAAAVALIAAVSIRRAVRPVAALEANLREVLDAYDRARLDARMDPLTGLGNHRAFQEELTRQVADALREDRPLSLVILDLDDLKRLNDTEGHASGDQLLATVGRLIRATNRASIARSGSAATSSRCCSRPPAARRPTGWPGACWPARPEATRSCAASSGSPSRRASRRAPAPPPTACA